VGTGRVGPCRDGALSPVRRAPVSFDGKAPHRRLAVVNEVSGDTIEPACPGAGQPHQPRWDAKLVVPFEAQALYSVPFAPEDH
jgi:hypothetical protein